MAARTRRRREAVRWFARLHAPRASGALLERFGRWRRRDGAEGAYREVDAVWRASWGLRDDPAVTAALGQALARPGSRRASAATGLGLAGAAAAAVGLVLVASLPTRLSSPVGKRRVVRLSDDSVVVLDTGTRLAVRLGPRRRRVDVLTGQALFQVAHDPGRPFVVEAAGATVTALGTRFDVRTDKGAASVALVEGVVRVARGEAAWRLKPGQTLRIDPKGYGVVSRETPALDWTRGRLMFRNTFLTVAVAEANRYRERPIRLGVGVDTRTRVSGVFDAADPEAFVAAVSRLTDLDVVPDRGGVLLRPRLPGPGENIVRRAPGGGPPSSVYPPDSPRPET